MTGFHRTNNSRYQYAQNVFAEQLIGKAPFSTYRKPASGE